MNEILTQEVTEFKSQNAFDAGGEMSSLISNDTIIGDLLSLNYDESSVLVHDQLRQKVGGLPMGCFLLASRCKPGENIDANTEDASLILLRVIGNAQLANHADTEKYRLDAGFRATDTPDNWDAANKTDQFTLNQLRHAGVRCSVLGTFRAKFIDNKWQLAFGADISNFYSGQGMKVYKPIGDSLGKIVNYTKPTGNSHSLAGNLVEIGNVRYCSSEIKSDPARENVPVGIEPTDLLARRTALFGMSRSGKSNTIKIIASSIFKLRKKGEKGRVGQLIFDVNGEYCNINPQDEGCLRNIWRTVKNTPHEDVVTYGLFKSKHDPKRNLLRFNFFGDLPKNWKDRESVTNAMQSLIAGKEIINEYFTDQTAAEYVKGFVNTNFSLPEKWDISEIVRYQRRVLVYCSFLAAAGFNPPRDTASLTSALSSPLFSEKLCEKMPEPHNSTLQEENVPWEQLQQALIALYEFMDTESYNDFNNDYIRRKKHPWADTDLVGLLGLLKRPEGISRTRSVKERHDPHIIEDYTSAIVSRLQAGKLVLVDQSIGSVKLLRIITDRIMEAVFRAQQEKFISPTDAKTNEITAPPDIIVYAEEAHNLLPAKGGDLTTIWAKVAKEGSKFHIGMVFSTQEPSSILSNILKNTDNWFVAHLNNSDEVKELKKYYDFGEFVSQILKVPDTGFLRMRCLSNPYIVPVQVHKFKAPTEKQEAE